MDKLNGAHDYKDEAAQRGKEDEARLPALNQEAEQMIKEAMNCRDATVGVKKIQPMGGRT